MPEKAEQGRVDDKAVAKPFSSPPQFKNELGLIHVYTGDGKGKTTASLGLALRAVGQGFRVCVIQFMKGGYYFGEILAAEKYLKKKLKFFEFGQSTPYAEQIKKGVVKPSKAIFFEFEDEKEVYKKGLKFAKKVIQAGRFDLVILDEINVVLSMKHMDVKDVLDLMLSKPKHVELVLTGRGAPEEIKDAADYVMEVKMVKHPFERKRKKVLGRRGIEY